MPHIVASDSVLARTAAELLTRHAVGADGGMCQACGHPAPCPAARHADLVLAAAPALKPLAEPAWRRARAA